MERLTEHTAGGRPAVTEDRLQTRAAASRAVAIDGGPGPLTAMDALLFATTPAVEGGAAALLPIMETTALGRLLEQLESLGVERAWVVTRPDWRRMIEAVTAEAGLQVTVVEADDLSGDLRTTAEIASEVRGPLVAGSAHIVTHREALVGLLADPRPGSGVLASGLAFREHWSFFVRSTRRRLVSAASPYHRVTRPTGFFLGLMKLDARERDVLAASAQEIADLAVEPRPERWMQELERKTGDWRLYLWREAVEAETGVRPDLADSPDPASFSLDHAAEAAVALRRRVSAGDPLPLLLVGLVRTGAELFPSDLRRFFYAAPLSGRAAALATDGLRSSDEDRALLDSAVKANDGFFTTFFVSPYSKYLARFAARRGRTPNQITTASLVLGVLAASSFAVGNRAALIVGAVLLQMSFTVDCVDGQLARYTRSFSNLGAWLDSVFDRTKEYLVYAGLAVGSLRGFDDDVWILAAAALTLQTVRHVSDFSFASAQRANAVATPPPLIEPEDSLAAAATRGAADLADAPLNRRLVHSAGRAARAFRRTSPVRWVTRILALPIGERFALISLTAAIATPRVTFTALLVWGALGATYAFTRRILITYAVTQRLHHALTR
jgi:phosphatidylglycerophosphate synthase